MRAMVEIAATATVASEIYARMERNLAIVRRQLGKPLTLSDKVLLGHLEQDPCHPVVLGSLYSSGRTPPYALAAKNDISTATV